MEPNVPAHAPAWRAYNVLKEPEKAKAALADARRALDGDPAALRSLSDLARELGIEG